MNPLRDTEPAETRNPKFDFAKFPCFGSGKEEPGPEVWSAVQAVIGRFLEGYLQLADVRQFSEMVEQVQEKHNGNLADPAAIAELEARWEKHIAHRSQHRNFSQPEQ